jgi:hypothetical protein
MPAGVHVFHHMCTSPLRALHMPAFPLRALHMPAKAGSRDFSDSYEDLTNDELLTRSNRTKFPKRISKTC